MKCWSCCGPLLGHQEAKCKENLYEDQIVRRFEDYLKQIPGFREAVSLRNKTKEDSHTKKIRELIEEITRLISQMEEKRSTTQLVKSRLPPLWSGQEFDRWCIEAIIIIGRIL